MDACWELVNELRKGRKGLTHSREALAEMVAAMLGWGSPALAFIRRVNTSPAARRFPLSLLDNPGKAFRLCPDACPFLQAARASPLPDSVLTLWR